MSIIDIIQWEKKEAYTRGAVFGLFGNVLPAEITAKIAKNLTVVDGMQAARTHRAAYSLAEQHIIDGVIKLGKF